LEASGEGKEPPLSASAKDPEKKFEQGARVMFRHREGFIFDIRMKIGKGEPKLVEMAADTEYQRQKWAPALWDFQPTVSISSFYVSCCYYYLFVIFIPFFSSPFGFPFFFLFRSVA